MNNKNNIVEAEYSLETKNYTSSHLPATLESVQLLRHPKAEKDPSYLAEIRGDLALDIELGLKTQYDMDQQNLLKTDIDSLTKSNEYHQVSTRMLERLFHFGELRFKSFPYNAKEAIIQSIVGAKFPIIHGIFAFVLILASIFLGHQVHGNGIPSTLFCCATVICAIGAIVFLGYLIASLCGIREAGEIDICYEFISLNLILEDVKNTMVAIPRMAKLKMKEAKDSGLFEAFTIAYPKFTIDRREYHPRFNVDPVILGVTKDNRMFMVCWWDIKKDIDRAKSDIRMFKKFKVV